MKKWYLFMALVFVSLNAAILASSATTGEEWKTTYKEMGWTRDTQETHDGGYIIDGVKDDTKRRTMILSRYRKILNPKIFFYRLTFSYI